MSDSDSWIMRASLRRKNSFSLPTCSIAFESLLGDVDLSGGSITSWGTETTAVDVEDVDAGSRSDLVWELCREAGDEGSSTFADIAEEDAEEAWEEDDEQEEDAIE